ncbi:DUF6327 family protein [Flavobacterium taihuense]|uniref:Glutaminyl-tRNA synthetase n=1 Tax=Flavobacterium taihuense TaxID=2857508 RepID=A0ABS6XQE1_9FLAO|nr:DUF6327 family protein [Flavobacterium taihuense]MBW4358898.1 hypothetical protein [Flavobacterium taihuense]
MESKKYSSYAEIDRELEILKLEKEISYQKLVLSVQRTRDSITPENIVNGFLAPYKDAIPSQLLSIIKAVFPYVVSYFLNRKRGN